MMRSPATSTFARQGICNAVKAVAFILAFLAILTALSNLFTPTANDASVKLQSAPPRGFYAEPQNTIDIVGIGNSNMENGFSPMQLWNRYGYTAYNCGIPAQVVFDTYSTLASVFTRQKPRIVILDADGLHARSGSDPVQSFLNGAAGRLFPLLEYHDRWKPFGAAKRSSPPADNPDRGYVLSGAVKPLSRPRPKSGGPSTYNLDPTTRYQLDLLNRLCVRNGAKLVMVYIPTAFS